MSKSLQDQLLELGLARERPAPKKRSKGPAGKGGKRRPGKSSTKRGAPNRSGEPSLEEAFRLRAKAEKEEVRAARRRKQLEDQKRREINDAIKAIVEPNRLNDTAAEESRFFLYKGRIRKVHVTPEQREALNEGRLGVVYLAGGYHLLAPEHIEAVKRISAEHVPDLDGETGAEDEPDAPEAAGGSGPEA